MTQLIGRDDLAELIKAGSVTVVDALPAAYFDQEHLPGAINLVESEVAERAPALLPHKEAAIVTYCSNANCQNSQAVATRLRELGYRNVRKYRDGIQDWVEAGYATESAARP